MDRLVDSESGQGEQRYQDLQQKARVFSTDFAQLIEGQPTNEVVHKFVERGMHLEGEFYSLMSSVRKAKNELDQVFPNRGDIYRAISDSLLEALDRLPYNQLSTEEMDKFVKLFASRKGLLYGGSRRGGWYHFGELHSLLRVASPEEELLQTTVKDRSLVLTSEQEDQIGEHENNVFKLHITVPEEGRIDVFKAIITTLEHDSDLRRRLVKEKKARGKTPETTREEFEQQGERLNLAGWKMHDFTDPSGRDIADFVFYVPETWPNPPERAVKMARQLAEVLKPAGLPLTTRAPRYNVPVCIEGKVIPGLFIAQGNGDFKDYLLKKHGTGGLERYFDAKSNFALRNKPQIPEVIKQII